MKLVVGYGLTSKMRLPAITSLIEESRLEARDHGRAAVIATDVHNAMMQYQIPSDQAMQYAFEDPRLRLKGKSVSNLSPRLILSASNGTHRAAEAASQSPAFKPLLWRSPCGLGARPILKRDFLERARSASIS